jgi:hypothetical protein
MKLPGQMPPAKHGARMEVSCEACAGATTLTRRESHPTRGPSYELQTYTCRRLKCGHINQVVVKTPGAA